VTVRAIQHEAMPIIGPSLQQSLCDDCRQLVAGKVFFPFFWFEWDGDKLIRIHASLGRSPNEYYVSQHLQNQWKRRKHLPPVKTVQFITK
jgi:hypothetical protein